MWRSPSSRQIHRKYIYMWNNSYRTPTERWQKTSDFPKGCTRRGDSEHRLKELQRRAQATAISMDTRDGHETLRLLLQPPRSLCASTGHYPHLPCWETVQPATARVPGSRDNFPGRTHGTPQAAATSCRTLPPQACPALRTPPSPTGLSEPEPLNQSLL